FMTYTSRFARPTIRTNAICRPSGDQAGSEAFAAIRFACLPSAAAMKIAEARFNEQQLLGVGGVEGESLPVGRPGRVPCLVDPNVSDEPSPRDVIADDAKRRHLASGSMALVPR